jgi:rhodanese-related sulfurtransferase
MRGKEWRWDREWKLGSPWRPWSWRAAAPAPRWSDGRGLDAALLEGDPAAVLLDIRTPEEFGEGRLEGAVNIDFYAADFAGQLAELDRDATYVIYCRSGNRTTAALDTFRDLGFTSVHAVEGGIVAWEATGHLVIRG